MKRSNLLWILVALLALAGILLAEQRSSSTGAQSQQNTAAQNTSWYCPMMSGSGWMNDTHSGMRGSGWMMGNGNVMPHHPNNAMGQGMMYNGYMMDGQGQAPSSNPAPTDSGQQPRPKQ